MTMLNTFRHFFTVNILSKLEIHKQYRNKASECICGISYRRLWIKAMNIYLQNSPVAYSSLCTPIEEGQYQLYIYTNAFYIMQKIPLILSFSKRLKKKFHYLWIKDSIIKRYFFYKCFQITSNLLHLVEHMYCYECSLMIIILSHTHEYLLLFILQELILCK